MKITVYGAGVLPGSNLARNIFRTGKDVDLLAREFGRRKWTANQGQIFTA